MKSRLEIAHRSEINITPYIDVLLVLLIILMVMQPLIKHQLESRVPHQPDSEKPARTAPAIVLTLDADSNLHLNSQRLAFSDLRSSLIKVFSARSNKVLFVRGDPVLAYGTVVRVMDIAKGAGVAQIALLSE